MVKTEAYTFPKHWPDKPACAGSSPAEGTKNLRLKHRTPGLNSYMLTCKYCSRNEKSLTSKSQHEIYCKSNPNKKIKKPSMGMLGKKGSNQYIKGTATPLTDSGREKIRETNRKRVWTDESRLKHSESMKLAVVNNPESYTSTHMNRTKRCVYEGIKFDSSWELDFYKWCRMNGIECTKNTIGFKYEWNGIRTYFPDFYLPGKDEYVEIKGYKTDRDSAKWDQFPQKLRIILKEDIIRIQKNEFVL